MWRCIATGTSTILSLGNDLEHFHHFFYDLKYGERLSAPRFRIVNFTVIQIRSFTILLFALNVLLRDSVALVNLTSVDDFFQI